MKKNTLRRSFIAVAVLSATVISYAQSSGSGYFLEGFSSRYQLNPAFSPERRGFVVVPALGNIQLDAQGNVGMSNFMYESTSKPGMLTTFMSSDVKPEEFLDNLPDVTKFNVGVNMDILGFGFGAERWFTSINAKLRNNEQVNIPKELFAFMKSGLAQDDYMINDINVKSISYLEWSVTHSHKIGDNLTIGAGVKFLEGIAYADLNIDEIDARLSGDAWKVKSNGTLRASVPSAKFKYDPEAKTLDGVEFDEFDAGSIPSSYGFAVDLGAEYDMKDLVKGLKLSAAITDIGFVNWTKLSTFATDNQDYVTFNGFHNYKVNGDNDDAMKDVEDDFKNMILLNQTADDGNENIALDAVVRVGATYALPMVDWLSFGQLFSLRTGLWPYFESRTSVRLSPCGWFDATGNLGLSSYGASMGLMLNLHPNGINFFLAVDRLKAEFNPQFIPLHDFGVNVSLGLNLVFGEKRN